MVLFILQEGIDWPNDRASKLVYIKHNLKIEQDNKKNKNLLNTSGYDTCDFPNSVEEEEDASIMNHSDNEIYELYFKAVNSCN